MKQEVIDLVSIITIILLLIFSFVLIRYEKGNRKAHRVLAAFLLLNSFFILAFISSRIFQYTSLDISWLNSWGARSGYLFGPLLFLYLKAQSDKNFSFKQIYLLHAIPFILALVIPHVIDLGRLFWLFTFNLHVMIYMILCLIDLKKYEQQIRGYFSSVEKSSLEWLKIIVIAFIIMWMTDFVHHTLKLFWNIGDEINKLFIFISLSINFVFAVLLFLKGLQHPEILSGISEEYLQTRYAKSRLTDLDKHNYKQKLLEYVENKKPYLNPNLTLKGLSEEIEIHTKTLSQVINETLGKNFFDFINSYRIEEAKRIMIKDYEVKKTILEVIYESGFNSKSVFNAVFKKHTGLTPTEFRRKKSA